MRYESQSKEILSNNLEVKSEINNVFMLINKNIASNTLRRKLSFRFFDLAYI
jgi:hypothetical protein